MGVLGCLMPRNPLGGVVFNCGAKHGQVGPMAQLGFAQCGGDSLVAI